MILLVGQVAREATDREAFQEIDYRRMFGQMAKWVAQIEDARRIPELISQAFHTRAERPARARSWWRCPRTCWSTRSRWPTPAPTRSRAARRRRTTWRSCANCLSAAERPMVIVGGGGWSAEACADMRAFVEANGLPVCASFRNQDLFDNRHPNYAGDLGVGVGPALGKRLKACDLIIAVGPRLGEATTGGYTLFDLPVPKQKLVHVHASAEELGRVYQATLPINSGMQDFAAAAKAMKPVDGKRWKADVADGARRVSRQHQARPAARRGQHGRGHRLAEQAPARRCHRHQRRRQLRRLPAPLLPVSRLQDPARADQRRDGLRRAGGGGGQDRRAQPHGRVAGGRRLLPDERPGVRDGRAARRQHRDRGRRQRHVRHHPHAPGARVSDARARHRAQEPRLRGLRPRLRRPRRDGREDRRLRAGLRARAGRRQARDHPCEDRCRGADLAHHADASCANSRWRGRSSREPHTARRPGGASRCAGDVGGGADRMAERPADPRAHSLLAGRRARHHLAHRHAEDERGAGPELRDRQQAGRRRRPRGPAPRAGAARRLHADDRHGVDVVDRAGGQSVPEVRSERLRGDRAPPPSCRWWRWSVPSRRRRTSRV